MSAMDGRRALLPIKSRWRAANKHHMRLLLIFLSFLSSYSFADDIEKTSLVEINLLQTALYASLVPAVVPDLTYIPIHIDFHYRASPNRIYSLGLIYRYENYDLDVSTEAAKPEDKRNPWINYHEGWLLAGVRYSPVENWLQGPFFLLRFGMGYATSPLYEAITVNGNFELGQSVTYDSGLTLSWGGGVLLNIPVYEKPSLTSRLSIVGWLFHRIIPIARVSVGYSF